ncbi:alginate O-acetyltransferase AlgF [Neopusillimonas aromaticivorans]|uniref:alginate O-acetyltransferase AlgF n=1 Tax=Neopusillimonas aromaticivorans TaxID=2979868 RepID=UPI00259A7AC5|nr:alginate O-acetyltransferase AlgF [Neopusillimonas aromaticivorans]WJJ94302.1 alginate O-acetyltransferase AlgF [Neopusillimonas aromaticivorans]
MITLRAIGMLLATLAPVAAMTTEIPLYETGPAEDSAFIRFVNGSNAPLNVKGGQAKNQMPLPVAKPVSDFLPVSANRPLKGDFVGANSSTPSETTVKAGEFVTVIALPDTGDALKISTIRETPDDFNALKASLAVYNLSSTCTQASIKVAGRDLELFKTVAAGTASERRMINPVKLDIQLYCNNVPVNEPVALGALSAGTRYTIFLLPDATTSGTRIYPATDNLVF